MSRETEPNADHDCCATTGSELPLVATNPVNDPAVAGGSSSDRGERIAKFGTIVSAVMASSCCWLPPVLILMGLSGAGIVATLEAYRPMFMVVTFGFLGTAFYFTYRPRHARAQPDGCSTQTAQTDCCSPATQQGRRLNMLTLNKSMLWVVTALAVVFLFFPQYVTALLAPDYGEFTADMNRTVLAVEGMTCLG